MYQRVIVPADGSDRSWKVTSAAAELASRWDCPVEVVSVVRSDSARQQTQIEVEARITESAWSDRGISRVVAAVDESIGNRIADVANEHPGSLVVMSSTGHGRSAAVLGSNAEEIVRHTTTPVLLYGPGAKTEVPSGTSLIIAVDGSELSEQVLGLAGAWAVDFDLTPWIVTVGEVDTKMPPDVAESARPHWLAIELEKLIARPVQFEILHGNRPSDSLTDFADSMNAAALVETTHARQGFDRLLSGSVTMSTVRHSHIPVLVMRGLSVSDNAHEEEVSR